MGLETGDTIEDLDSSFPLSGDFQVEGDDHLRLIKNVIKTTFPGSGGQGFAGPILSTEDELNFSQGATSNIQAQLDAIISSLSDIGSTPIGGIIMYNGAFSSIPPNYQLCDGTNGTPDLTDAFAFGTNTELELNQSGGSNDAVVVLHNHIFAGDTMDPHDHEAVGSAINQGSDSGSALRYTENNTTTTSSDSAGTPTGTISNSGVSGTDANRPAFIKLAFIRRMS